MSKKSCIDCKCYYEGHMDYHFYNGCNLLEIEYFKPDGCDCVDEDGNIIEEELEKILKNK